MNRQTKNLPGRPAKGKKGHALIMTLILMGVGIIIIAPLLMHMNTGAKTGQFFQDKTDEIYAADAGIEDGTWQIKYDNISTFKTLVAYSSYNYSNNWSYSLQVNGKLTNVTVANVWIPRIAVPNQSQATNITQNGKLIVTDSVVDNRTCKINIIYNNVSSDPPLKVTTLGVWLPAGFTYVNGSSNLNASTTKRLYSSENSNTYYGSGQVIIWTFPDYPFAGDKQKKKKLATFPGVDNTSTPMISTITFNFTSQKSGVTPDAISWITTSGVKDIPFSWDADTKVYHITSTAGGSRAEAYLSKYDLRQLGSAINGEYRAIGNSLMINLIGGTRRTLLNSSSANVTDIPSDATLAGAYLYWSGRLKNKNDIPLASVNFSVNGNQTCFNATTGLPQRGNLPITSERKRPSSCRAPTRRVMGTPTLVTGMSPIWSGGNSKKEHPGDLTGNANYKVGNASGVILGNTGSSKAYAGWSLIIIYTSPSTKGHQLYLYDKFTYAYETQPGQQHGSDIDPTEKTSGPGGVISGFIVPQQIPGETFVANLTVFVGEGDKQFAGDFLAFNAPAQYWSNPWSIPDGNPSKLWDGIYIPGNNTAAKPDNVWNGLSQSGLNEGVDIKTFSVTWASKLLNKGDTSARIDLPTWEDSWDLVYMILSFRSETTTRGNIFYQAE